MSDEKLPFYLIILIIGVFIGAIIGVGIGADFAIDRCLEVGFRVIDEAGVDLTIYSDNFQQLIRQNIHKLGL